MGEAMTAAFVEIPAREADPGLPRPQRTIAIAAVLLGMALVVLDAAIANVALPTIAASLHVTPAMSVLVVTAYQTALVMMLLPAAALGESLGCARVFAAGVTLFTVASLACALSPSLPWLIAARFVQGTGGAAVMALGVALLRVAVPLAWLGAAIGWNALTVALSSAAGPVIGAGIMSIASWPWLFAVNLPLGAAALLAVRALPFVAGTMRRIDLFSVLLNSGAFAAMVIGTELLTASPLSTLALWVVALICGAALVRRELHKDTPLVPLDLLRAPPFRISVVASICCFAGQTAGLVALPFHLQQGLMQSPFMTGLYMTPWPLTVACVAPIVGRITNFVATARLCAAGGAVLAAGLTAACILPDQDRVWPLAISTALCGLGFGLFNVPNNRNMFLAAPKTRSAAAGGMQGTARLVGQTAGAVIATLLLGHVAADAAPRIALAIGAVLTLAAGLASLLRGRQKKRLKPAAPPAPAA
jgi:DHA2 family multidrug resistance protein-like MFS transporter